MRIDGMVSSARRIAATFRPVLLFVAVVGVLVLTFLLPTLLGGSLKIFATVVVIAIFAMMVYGVDLLLSYLGDISLGHTAFWALGAYVTAVLSINLKWGGWLTLVGAVAAGLLVASILGLAVYRSRAFIFSLSTYASSIVLASVASHWRFVGGSDGLVGLPRLDLSLGPLTARATSMQDMWTVAFALLVVTILLIARFRQSRLGKLAFMAHLSPDLAISMGVDVSRVRFQLLVLSSVPTAAAGWLYAYYRSYVGPDLFDMYFLILMLTAAVIVGRRVLLGPVIGVALIIAQQNLLSLGTHEDQLILGAALVLILVLSPAGVVGLVANAPGPWRRRMRADRALSYEARVP